MKTRAYALHTDYHPHAITADGKLNNTDRIVLRKIRYPL